MPTNLEYLKRLQAEATPKMQIADMRTHLDTLLVQFSGNLPAGEVLGFLTDKNLEAFDELRSQMSSAIDEIENARAAREKLKGMDTADVNILPGEEKQHWAMGAKSTNEANRIWRSQRDAILKKWPE